MIVTHTLSDSHDINSSGIECLHTFVMVQAGVDRVDSDSVDSKLFQIWDISSTVGWVRQGVEEG